MWSCRVGGQVPSLGQNISSYTPWSQHFEKCLLLTLLGPWDVALLCSLRGHPAAFPLPVVSTISCHTSFPRCLHRESGYLPPPSATRWDEMKVPLAAVTTQHSSDSPLQRPHLSPKPCSCPNPAVSMSASKNYQKEQTMSSDLGPHSQLRGPSSREEPARRWG